MSKQQLLSLPAAIFININIMLGAGTFINTVILAQHVGALGFSLYLAAGAIMLPLILSIAKFSSLSDDSNFYNFGATINPYFGFISSWGYFIGKLASASLSIFVFSKFVQHIFPAMHGINTVHIGLIIVSLFVLLNMLNVKTGSRIQYGFLFMKAMPLLFAVIMGLFHFDFINIGSPHQIWSGIPIALPLALFCCLGFEATCSLTKVIKDSKKNAPIAIITSFLFVIGLSALYQLVFYGSLGTALSSQINYTGAFPALINLSMPSINSLLNPLLSTAIATSALGGAYGIMYSNPWNLFTLAEKKHLPFSKQLTKRNSHAIPYWCIIIEGLICFIYLSASQGAQIPLQYTATLACILSYTISVMGFIKHTPSILGYTGLISCFTLLATCVYGFIATSLLPLYLFGAIIVTGTTLYYFNK